VSALLAALHALLRDPVPYRGSLGFLAVVTLERLNAIVGLLVGLATLVYLSLRIAKEVAWHRQNRRELRDQNSKPSSEA